MKRSLDPRKAPLVPRLSGQGYTRAQVDERRRWVEEQTGAELPRIGAFSVSSDEMRGNVENPVGTAQVPLGVAGPLAVEGEHARGVFYVPLATTEGVLVRSYERGMVALTRSGGATARIQRDENRISPVFVFDDLPAAHAFATSLPDLFDDLRTEAEATTGHGRLLRVEPRVLGFQVIVTFFFHTGDAHGMNMIARATDRACRWLVERTDARRFLLMSGAESEKRASGSLWAGGKGKTVTAAARLPRRVVRAVLGATPQDMAELWHHTVAGQLTTGTLGYTGHAANGLTALFIATGQDVANVANAAVVLTQLRVDDDGDLRASITLPSLTVATVGGGTGLGTATEALAMLGCEGSGKAPKLAEIVAATILAGELSMGAALVSGEFVDAHETYGRNRPGEAGEDAAS